MKDVRILADLVKPLNPHSPYAKVMRTRNLSIRFEGLVKDFPNFSKSGSIREMKRRYYGKGVLLVKCGNYNNVTSDPQIYYQYAI